MEKLILTRRTKAEKEDYHRGWRKKRVDGEGLKEKDRWRKTEEELLKKNGTRNSYILSSHRKNKIKETINGPKKNLLINIERADIADNTRH